MINRQTKTASYQVGNRIVMFSYGVPERAIKPIQTTIAAVILVLSLVVAFT